MDTMNSRERMLAAITHQPVDRVPMDIWAVPEVLAKLRAHFGPGKNFRDELHLDGFGGAAPKYVGPPPAYPSPWPECAYWGIQFKKIKYDTGEYEEIDRSPLQDAQTIDDLEAYAWPDADAWFDYSQMADSARKQRQARAIMCGYLAPFTYHIYLRGLENALMDPLINPEFTHHFLQRLSDFLYRQHRRMFEACEGLLDVAQVTDDYGAQNAPMMSLDTFRTFYRPHVARFAGLAKEFGLKVFHHDDGAIRPFIPDLIELGVDVLNPIQWRCPGMDMAGLKRDFGGRLTFHGGIDNQHTLPFGSEADVRAEVRQAIDTLASDKTGYILAPCHNIQAVSPLQNILAMYDEAYNYGRF